ncbi:PEP-CTERM sorting domain-containing protein [Aquabacterium soli]|jgi:hypothetical protein|uniref:PEP-CTERM sorting domain-containing protein n=1 Tax=Aquabacterium soli TaxID=2493092 RepID=A0A3R8T1L0_9BURK|nr:PEP-CTERM sorting domain-containing protein [Aquabacterium soli]RRR99992.1 PEP-CTERM sorting domain-containing protein [Aquabacterium soli]
MNAVIKTISRAAVAVAAAVAAHGAMAANATVQLDTSVISANSLTVAAIGADTYSSSTGVLTAPVASASNKVVDFGNSDGFSISLTVLFAKQTLSFTNFAYDLTTNTLFGTLTGSGSLLSGIAFTGDLLKAGTTSSTNSILTASNFGVSAGLTAYLTTAGVSTASLSSITSSIKSVSVPTAPAVPEPSTYALMGLGLVGISLIARQKRQA